MSGAAIDRMKKVPSSKSAGNARPITLSQRVEKLNRWREQYNPLRGLTLRRAVRMAAEYFRGEMADLQWTYFFIEQTDPDLLALIEMRLGRIMEMDWDVLASEEAEAGLARRQIEHLRERLDLIDNLDEAIEHLAISAFRGYAHAEKIYEGGDLVHLEIVDQWNVTRDGLRGPWKYNPQARTTTFGGLPAEAIMPPDRFLFRESRRPINRIALFKFVRGNLCEKDWDAFVEIFGFLGGVVIGPPNVPEEKAAEFEAAARALAEGGSGYLPNGAAFSSNETAKGAHPFRERLEHLTEKLVLAGTGGKLTMLAESGSGTLAGGAHTDVFDQIAAAEARRISEIINRQIAAPSLDEAFPGQAHAAYFRLASEDAEDTSAVIDQILKLEQAGFSIEAKEASERTGYKLTRKPISPLHSPISSLPSPISNRASAARAQESRAAALRMLARGFAADQAPLLRRLEAALHLPDDRIDSALAAIQADFPGLAREVLAGGSAARASEDIIGTALVEGAAGESPRRIDSGDTPAPANRFDPSQLRDADGKWSATGAIAGKHGLVALAKGSASPEHVGKLPPAWSGVFVNPDPAGSLQAVGIDAKGRVQRVYSEKFVAAQAEKKFSRIKTLEKEAPAVFAQTVRDLDGADLPTRENAAAMRLIQTTGIRPGSDTDTLAKVKAYGATTLEGRHVVLDGESTRLRFTGKKGVALDIPVEDPAVASILRARKSAAGDGGRLFATNDAKLRDYAHTLGSGKFKPKDFRTLKGTSTARELVSRMPIPADMKQYKRSVHAVAKDVSSRLGNTPIIALQSYIDPNVFVPWKPAA